VTVSFRNVDASPADDVRTWPYEGLVTVIDRGLVPDWSPVLAEIRRAPWGQVARRVEHYLGYRDSDGVSTLFRLSIEDARRRAELDERAAVARRVRVAIDRSGLTSAEFARRVGTSAPRMSTYRNGTVVPASTMLVRIERLADELASTSGGTP
jgi:hypothetical protein